jgi:hypothetical protein
MLDDETSENNPQEKSKSSYASNRKNLQLDNQVKMVGQPEPPLTPNYQYGSSNPKVQAMPKAPRGNTSVV